LIKSHGSEKNAIVPRLLVQTELTNFKMLKEHLNRTNVPAESPPRWIARRPAIAKFELFSIIESYASLQFSAVILEACDSVAGITTAFSIPSNVEALLMVRPGSVGYRNFKYALIDEDVDSPIEHRLLKLFGNHNVVTIQHRTPYEYLYFIPLFVMILVFVFKLRSWVFERRNRKQLNY